MKQRSHIRIIFSILLIVFVMAGALPLRKSLASGVVGDGTPASCTEQAFDFALTTGGSISFNCGGPKTLIFSGEKIINIDTAIDGGSLITLDGDLKYRLFTINAGKQLTLNNITLTHGHAAGPGGAVLVDGALIGNKIIMSLSQAETNFGGGAIYVTKSGGATLTSSRIVSNTADTGGGIDNDGTLVLMVTTLAANSAISGTGGALSNAGTALLTENSIYSNSATLMGGGVDNGNLLIIERSALYGNSATDGAGISTNDALTLTSSSVSANTASHFGGGLHVASGNTTLSFNTLSGNTAAKGAHIYNVAGSVQVEGVLINNGGCDGIALTSAGHNLDAGNTCSFSQPSDLINTNPQLQAFADNGGTTLSHLLGIGSPAIDAGGSTCPASDQRLDTRPKGAACDIGAIEMNALPPPSPTPKPAPKGNMSGLVTNSKSQALKSVVVSACQALAKSVCANTSTDNAGSYNFADLDVGEYEVRGNLNGFYSTTVRARVRSTETTTVNFSLRQLPPPPTLPPPGGTLQGHVVYEPYNSGANMPVEDALIEMRPITGTARVYTASTNSLGDFVINNAPSGAYLGLATKAGYHTGFAFWTVTTGQTVSRTVLMARLWDTVESATAPLDLQVRQVIVSQASQTWNNSIALVANHMTEVRAFVDVGGPASGPLNMPYRIDGYLQSDCGYGAASVNQIEPRSYIVRNWSDPDQVSKAWSSPTSTLNFKVPTACLVAGTRTFTVNASFVGAVPVERNLSNNTGRATVTFRPTQPLDIVFNPISLRESWSCLGTYQPPPTAAQMANVMAKGLAITQRWFPTTVTARLGPSFDICAALRNDGTYEYQAGWWYLTTVYGRLAFIQRLAMPRSPIGAYRMFYGVISESECLPTSERECSHSGYSLGAFSSGSGAGLSNVPETVPHELAHSLNSCHPGSDPHGAGFCYDNSPPFPNNHGGIGQWGIEIDNANVITTYSPIDMMGPFGNPIAHVHDFMSYGWPKWVSGHQWLDLLEEFDDDYSYDRMPAANVRSNHRIPKRPNVAARYLWVGGVLSGTQLLIQATHPVTLNLADVPVTPNDAGYQLQLLDVSGAVLVTTPIDLASAPHPEAPATVGLHAEGTSHDHHTAHSHEPSANSDLIPFTGIITFPAEARIAAVVSDTQVLVSQTLSGAGPVVTLVAPNGGEVFSDTLTASWVGNDPDDSKLTYNLMYSVDGGESWMSVSGPITTTTYTLNLKGIPGSDHALLRVEATDGANAASDDSDGPFVVPTKAPDVIIMSPADRTHINSGDSIRLAGLLMDLEDGSTDEGVSYTWTSDRDGLLGSGPNTDTQLVQAGLHTLTLTVTDRDGNAATRSVHVQVGTEMYLPLVWR